MPRLVVLAVLSVLLVGCDRADPPERPPATGSATADTAGQAAGGSGGGDQAARSQAALDSLIPADQPGCSAAVGVEGRVVWSGARGVADLRSRAPLTPETVFDIASVSKQFTATAALLLVQAGELSPRDPLSRHVPGLPSWAAGVTVDQLVHHTSGIPDYVDLLVRQGHPVTGRTTQRQALDAVRSVPELTFRPGSRWAYSNSNYLLLGEIVHRVSGQPLPEYLARRVFGPLGLAMVMDPTSAIPGKALSYEPYLSSFRVADSRWEQVGDGAVQTTPSELVRWADNYRTGQLGGPELLRQQLAGARETTPGGERYGAGITSYPDGTLGHDGGWAGFVTTFRVSADRRKAVAVACNVTRDLPGAIAQSLAAIWR